MEAFLGSTQYLGLMARRKSNSLFESLFFSFFNAPSTSAMVAAAARISSRFIFLSSLTYRSLTHPMSSLSLSAANDVPGRRVISIDVVSDT